MASEDKLMGKRDNEFVFAGYRIDFDSTDDIRYKEVEVTDEQGNVIGSEIEERWTFVPKSPAPGHSEHPIKSGYQRKIIVENASQRDDVTQYLDDQGINYEVEDVSPTSEEKSDIRKNDSEHGVDAGRALTENPKIVMSKIKRLMKDGSKTAQENRRSVQNLLTNLPGFPQAIDNEEWDDAITDVDIAEADGLITSTQADNIRSILNEAKS